MPCRPPRRGGAGGNAVPSPISSVTPGIPCHRLYPAERLGAACRLFCVLHLHWNRSSPVRPHGYCPCHPVGSSQRVAMGATPLSRTAIRTSGVRGSRIPPFRHFCHASGGGRKSDRFRCILPFYTCLLPAMTTLFRDPATAVTKGTEVSRPAERRSEGTKGARRSVTWVGLG
jgi:hypothetical protein